MLLVTAVILLGSALFLFANTIVRETHSSTSMSTSSGTGFGHAFTYGEWTLTPDNLPVIIIGTTGTADLIILKTPNRDFSNYVCQQGHYEPSPAQCNCCFGGGNGFNNTILDSYLQTHQSQIRYSQTISNQNVTLNYPVTSPTKITAILTQLGSGVTRDYFRSTVTNQTVTYPLLGYSERPGTIWSLTNISFGLLAVSAASLFIALTRFRAESPQTPSSYRGSITRKCGTCGQENLYFAGKCSRCGNVLVDQAPRAQLPPQ